MGGARQAAVAAMAIAVWCLASCMDVPAPEGGVFSLSAVILPSPGLVAGDTMRDSLGAASPVRVVAFNVAGDTVKDVTAQWVVLDTFAHFAGSLLIGDHVSPSTGQRILAVVGGLQTQPVVTHVTLSPDTLVATDSLVYRKTYTLTSGDTVVASPEIGATVLHTKGAATATGVEAVVVRYAVTRAPPGNGNGSTVVLVSGNMVSARDTTDASGHASRALRLRLAATTATAVDTATVTATASYAGRTIGSILYTIIFSR